MHPILFHIPVGAEGLPMYSYGVMLGVSLVVGWHLTLGLAERNRDPQNRSHAIFFINQRDEAQHSCDAFAVAA